MPIQVTPCQPFSDIVVANSDAFCYCDIVFQTVSMNSSIRDRSSPILIEHISTFPEWTFSVRFYNPIKFSSVPGVNKDGLPDLSLFSRVPRCIKRFKTLYIVGSGCSVSQCYCRSFQSCFVRKADDPGDFITSSIRSVL